MDISNLCDSGMELRNVNYFSNITYASIWPTYGPPLGQIRVFGLLVSICHSFVSHTSYVPHTSMGSSFKSICHLLEDGKPEEMEIIY